MVWEREAIRASLTAKGFREETDRDHDFLVLHAGGLARAIYTKLSRSTRHRVYGNPVLADMSRQLKLTRKQLDALIECALKEPDYLALLRAQGVIR